MENVVVMVDRVVPSLVCNFEVGGTWSEDLSQLTESTVGLIRGWPDRVVLIGHLLLAKS